MIEDKYTCRNCRFSAKNPYVGGTLICRRYPPVVDPHWKVGSVFPRVKWNDSCGEIELVPEVCHGMERYDG